MTGRFAIVDPGLRAAGGHHYTLAVALSDAAQVLGYDVVWFCGCDLPVALVPRGVRAERVFPLSCYKVSGPRLWRVRLYNALTDRVASPAVHRAGWRKLGIYPFEHEFRAALQRTGIGPEDHVLLTSAEYLQYQGLLHLLESEPPERLPFIHVRTSYDENMAHNRKFGSRLPGLFRRFGKLGAVGRRVFFYAEIQELAEHFNRWALVRFETLENPAPADLPPGAPPGDPRPDRPLTILYPGQPRLEKGYHRLPAIVSALLARPGLARPVRFVVQSTPSRSGKMAREVAAIRDRLKQFSAEHVRLLERPMDNDAYYRLIAEADIVLLPYDAARYCNRPSMIALEAALLGKPMVVTAGLPLAPSPRPDSAPRR